MSCTVAVTSRHAAGPRQSVPPPHSTTWFRTSHHRLGGARPADRPGRPKPAETNRPDTSVPRLQRGNPPGPAAVLPGRTAAGYVTSRGRSTGAIPGRSISAWTAVFAGRVTTK
jgi:hypothetical protein